MDREDENIQSHEKLKSTIEEKQFFTLNFSSVLVILEDYDEKFLNETYNKDLN